MRVGTLGVLCIGALAATSGLSRAALIGPGTGIGETIGNVDTAGGTRTNVDVGRAVSLSAGTYTATSFSFTAGANGNVQPFLAVVTSGAAGTNPTYKLIAVGSDNTITGVSALTAENLAFGGGANAIFTLAATTTVYAGITNSAANDPVAYADPGPNGAGNKNDDHNAPAFAASSFVVGNSISGFSNAGLTREYAFSITATTPEPASLSFIAVGAGGLLVRRRRIV